MVYEATGRKIDDDANGISDSCSNELGVRDSRPVQIHEDNQACILMGNGMKSSRKAKHYEVRLHFLQDSIKTGLIRFVYCETDKQIADSLTKPLLEDKFVYFRDLMLHAPLAWEHLSINRNVGL